jgi:hypothetical protein
MSKKPSDAQKQDRAERNRRYQLAELIKTAYPQVDRLLMEMSFHDPDGILTPSQIRDTFTPEMKAFFEFACPHPQCVGGGFDLTLGVSEMIARREAEVKGKLTCSGWHDGEESRQRRCNLKLDFCVSARYKVGS